MYVFLCASLYGLFSTYLDVPLSLSALNAALLSFVSVFRLWYGLPFNYLHRSFVSLYFGLSVRPFLFLSLCLSSLTGHFNSLQVVVVRQQQHFLRSNESERRREEENFFLISFGVDTNCFAPVCPKII